MPISRELRAFRKLSNQRTKGVIRRLANSRSNRAGNEPGDPVSKKSRLSYGHRHQYRCIEWAKTVIRSSRDETCSRRGGSVGINWGSKADDLSTAPWVEVTSKGDGHIEARKYRGEELVCQLSSPDFQKAMIHTTIVGLEEDELWR